VKGGPGVLIDLGLEGGLEGVVGIVGTEEIGVADEEALLVVVGVDEPAGDAIGPVTADLPGVGVKDVPLDRSSFLAGFSQNGGKVDVTF
jgi:hypothetical protein